MKADKIEKLEQINAVLRIESLSATKRLHTFY